MALVTWGLSVFVTLLTLNFQLTLGEQLDCDLEPGAVKWDPNPFNTEVTVVWGYGYNLTCHSRSTCNGSDFETDDMRIEKEQAMALQLKPVEIQMGNRLWFEPSQHVGIPFPLELYKVDEEGFHSCDVSRGHYLEIDVPSNESFEVPQSWLEVGNNYFIVNPDAHPLVNCHMGERLNVTVKSNLCDHQVHGSMCSGWGLCVTYRGDPAFRCSCCGNYRGETCEIFDSCLSNPCQNGGACVHQSENFHRYSCNCPLGYLGTFCEKQTSNLCQLVTCENNSTCVGNSTHFQCLCPPGVSGTHCEVDINECASSPCVNGLCVDKRNAYSCYCEPGFQGHTCSERLRACSLSPCRNGGFCEDVRAESVAGSFRCHCKPGWTGKDCTTKIPACDPNPCTDQGTCSEFNGTFQCHCSPGFTGTYCEVNINDCDPNPCKFGGHCRDGINAHTCLCIHSHAGSNCQYTPVDMFSPVLDEVDAEGHVIHNPAHLRNLYIVASCLTALVLTMMAVLLGCYCRLGELCKRWCMCCGLSRFWRYKKQSDDMVVPIDVSTASDCPLAVDAFWSSPDPEHSTLAGHATRSAFGNQTV